jgi:thiosulfate reductase cytochrome b subunit
MRFTEHETDAGNLEWLIRKDGCMHCADPGCLKACPARGDHQARQRHRRFPPGPLHRLRLLHHRLPVQHSAHLAEGSQGLQMHLVFGPRGGRAGAGLRETCPTGAIVFGTKEDMKEHAAERIVDLKARLRQRRAVRPAGVGGTHVMYVLHHADTPKLYAGLPDRRRSVRWWACGRHQQAAGLLAMGAAVLAGFFHYVRVGPNRVEEDEHPTPPNLGARSTRRCTPSIRGETGHEQQDDPALHANQRTNHWLVAILFFMAGLSGLALFHPALFWLTHLFGGGPWTRILHPFMGVLMFVLFLGLVLRFWRANFFIANDGWLRRIDRVMVNEEEGVPPVGKYNAGQKLLFWTLLLCMLGLLFTGW